MSGRPNDTVTGTFTLTPADRSWARASVGMPMPRRYVDLGHLGSGSMGEVRSVRDTKLGITVAMKIRSRRGGVASSSVSPAGELAMR